jgi:hypothetical protein
MRAIAWTIVLLLTGVPLAPADLDPRLERISFLITAVEEGAGTRTVLSEALVDGPKGTDFTIHLKTELFRMEARFLTDLLDNGNLRIRSRLHTKRLYGYSKRNLPLYEEDNQAPEIELALDEALALLPFGQGGGTETLSIEIVPSRSLRSTKTEDGGLRPLEIEFLKNDPAGVISIEARRVPHRYVVDTQVVDGDVPVFAATSPALLEEDEALLLRPTSGDAGEYELRLRIREFHPGTPSGLVSFEFDVDRRHPLGIHPAARNWAGKARLNDGFEYDLKDETGRPLKLRMMIRLAGGESD